MAEQCYPDDEIVNFLGNFFELKVTSQDIKLLKPEFVQKVYCNFLLDFGASLDQINQLPIDICDSVRQHPHVYASVGRTMILAKAINHFLKHISKDIEFFPADLYDPKPKRTRKFISILIDFYYCAKDNIDTLITIEDKAKIKYEAKEQFIKDNDQKEEKLRQLKHASEETQIREEQMLKRIAEMKVEIQEVQGNKFNLKAQFDQTKVDIASYIRDIKAAELEILEKKERVELLSNQVVQASERQEIEERESRLATYRSDNAVRAENVGSLKKTLQVCESAADLISKELMPILQELQQEVANTNEHKTIITQHERTRRAGIEEAEDYDMKNRQIREILASRQEKISQMHIAWKLKKDVLQSEVDQCKSSMIEIWQNQTEDEIVSQDLQKERLKTIREIQEFKEQINQFDLFVVTNYNKILQAMEKHNVEVQASLAALVQAANKNSTES